MRIDSLTLRNFKCFSEGHLDMHPEFNVLLGINGTGKTSILEALRVAIGSLYLGLDKYKNRIEVPSIANDDIRLEHLEQQFPTEVSAQGTFESLGTSFEPHSHVWMRSVETRGGKYNNPYIRKGSLYLTCRLKSACISGSTHIHKYKVNVF